MSRSVFAIAIAFAVLLPVTTSHAADPVVREMSYYVPYDKIEEIFEETGRGIFLPYDEFLALWNKANPDDPTGDDPKPPAAAVIRGGTYTGTVTEDRARFEVTYTIEALQDGWSDVRLPLTGVAVENAEVSRADAIFSAQGSGYSLYLPEPGAYELKLTLSVRVTSAPGQKSVSFGIPPTAVSRLDLTIPEEELRVDVDPGLAVTQTMTEGDDTRVLAFLGNSNQVTVKWMPPVGKVSEDGALFRSEQWVRAQLGERMLKIQSVIRYTVLRGDVDTLRIRMPRNTRLLSVEGENISEWGPDAAGILVVKLHAPIQKTHQLALTFERILDQTPATLAIPFPQIEDVLKEEGWAVLTHDAGLLVRVTRTQGLSQLDPEAVPEVLRQTPIRVGFRYLAHPLSLDLAITKITPVVRSQTTSVVTLGKEEDHWFGWVDYSITKAGLFQLQLRIPDGWSVEQVGDPGTVEEFQLGDAVNGKRILSVSMKSRAFGDPRLPFRLVRDGTANGGEVELASPEVVGSIQDRGLLGVSAPRSLDLVTVARTNLLDTPVDELFRSGIMGQLSSESGIPRAFRYRESPASVRLRLEDKKTETDVIAQHLVEVADGKISFTHILDYNILYAPVEVVRFRAPSFLDETLKVETKQKTEARPVSSDGGMSLWEVKLQPPVLGGLTLTLRHSRDVQGLAAGQPFQTDLVIVHAASVRGEQGFVAIRKSEKGTLEVTPQAVGMEAIDATDLPGKLRRGQIYSAFRYFTPDPALALTLTRYDYEDLATTLVPLVRLQSILSPERTLKTKAWLYVLNTERQYLEVQLGPEAKIITIAVAGEKQRERRKKGGSATLIQIPRSSGARGFWVEIEYDEPIARSPMGSLGSVQISTPEIREGIPVGKVELWLHVPAEYAYFGWSGNLHERGLRDPGLWSRFKQVVSASDGVVPRANAATTVIPHTAEMGTLNVPQGYREIRFDSLAPTGHVSSVYMGWRLYWFVDFLIFLIGIGGGLWVLTRIDAPVQGAAGLLVVTLVLSAFSTGPGGVALFSLFLGCFAICLSFGLRHLGTTWQARRAERLAFAPDPYLEDAPPPPPAPPASAPKKPAPEEPAPETPTPTVTDEAPTPESRDESEASPRPRRRRKRGKKKTSRRKDDSNDE